MVAAATTLDVSELERLFQQWKTVAELQVKYVEALGQYKLETAKSELLAAVTAQEWATARMKARVAHELAAALSRLSRLRRQTAKRVQQLNRHALAVARIRDGEDLAPSQLALMWAGFTVFERMTPAAVLQQIIDTPLEEQARLGTSYLQVARPDAGCPDLPASVDNVHALLGWLRRNGCVPRRGTRAYHQVVGAVTAVGAAAGREITALQAALEQLEKGTYDTWQPAVIAALPDSVDARKIIKSGIK